MANENRFVVDLGKMKLQDSDRKGLAAAIQGAVLTFLASKYQLPGKTIKTFDDGVGVQGLFVGDDNGGSGG
jgi:hypothetical protein